MTGMPQPELFNTQKHSCEPYFMRPEDSTVTNVSHCLGLTDNTLLPTVRKNGWEKTLHDSLTTEQHSQEIHGTIAHQEQATPSSCSPVGPICGESDISWKVTGKKKKKTADQTKLKPTVGGIVNGYDVKRPEKTRVDREKPVQHVPNKLYVVRHLRAVHQMVHSKVNHLLEPTVVTTIRCKDITVKTMKSTEERCSTGTVMKGFDANESPVDPGANKCGETCPGPVVTKGTGMSVVEVTTLERMKNGLHKSSVDPTQCTNTNIANCKRSELSVSSGVSDIPGSDRE